MTANSNSFTINANCMGRYFKFTNFAFQATPVFQSILATSLLAAPSPLHIIIFQLQATYGQTTFLRLETNYFEYS